MATKGPDAFRTISEAADELGVPQHVLRFWETKFSFIRPMKRAGGRRFYRRQDIDVLRSVRRLLHDEGYTIKGVQRLHKEQGVRRLLATDAAPLVQPEPVAFAEPAEPGAAPTLGPDARHRLLSVLDDLESTKGRIDDLLGSGGRTAS
jgi:DNA-binding transcriptional MerR regulator